MNKIERGARRTARRKAGPGAGGGFGSTIRNPDGGGDRRGTYQTVPGNGYGHHQDHAGFPLSAHGTLTRASDWRHIRFGGTDAKEFEKPKEIISRILDEVGGEALTLMTMFGPFKAASFAFGDDELMFWAKEAPDDVAEGIKIIADGMTQWLQGYLDLGVDGLYYTAQFAEPGRFTEEQ